MTTCISIGTAQTLVLMGVHSGEVSMRKARDVYGKWFIDAVNSGRLFPCRVEDGRTGTKWFKVTEILALKEHGIKIGKIVDEAVDEVTRRWLYGEDLTNLK